MVKDHQEDIKEYRQEAAKADAAGRLAKETLPILQKHLQEAQALEKETAQKVFALRRVGGLISVDPDDARCLSPQPGVIFLRLTGC
jgi:hypothetical protein